MKAEALNPICEPRLLTHGRKTERAVILLHGFTNCPQMWAKFGEELFAAGSNVLIPRLPRHGLANRLTDSPAHLTANELRSCVEEAVREASELGEKVTVAGLSLGAVLSAYTAIKGDHVDRCVMIAPLFAAPGMPIFVSDALGFAVERLLPNVFVWWDRKSKADIAGPKHAYPRFATRGYGAMLQLGYAVRQAARRQPPKVRDLRVVLNAADTAVNNQATVDLVDRWRRDGAMVQVHVFPKEMGLLHDLIDPAQLNQQTSAVYPVLMDWITRDENVGLAP